MQIQWWEGAASSCAEAVLQSAIRECMRPEAGRMRKMILSSVVEALEKDSRSEGKHRGTEYTIGYGSAQLAQSNARRAPCPP
jgi:hypothetical protein